jgi:hypothetical protein
VLTATSARRPIDDSEVGCPGEAGVFAWGASGAHRGLGGVGPIVLLAPCTPGDLLEQHCQVCVSWGLGLKLQSNKHYRNRPPLGGDGPYGRRAARR